jgi:hypothetical protein
MLKWYDMNKKVQEKTRWVVQDNCNDDKSMMYDVFEKHNIPYKKVTIIPFSEEPLKIPEYQGSTIAYGTTILQKFVPFSWVWYDENTFKPSYWGEKIGNMYLNCDAEIMPLREVLNRWRYPVQFIRPNSDFKSFSGGTFMKGDFFKWVNQLQDLLKSHTTVTLDTEVSVSKYKKIEREWRFFIVDGSVIGHSQYRVNGRLDIAKQVEPAAYQFATEIANGDFQLHRGYVVDIGYSDGQYKVIEFNNFNSSGFYACDVESIILHIDGLS